MALPDSLDENQPAGILEIYFSSLFILSSLFSLILSSHLPPLSFSPLSHSFNSLLPPLSHSLLPPLSPLSSLLSHIPSSLLSLILSSLFSLILSSLLSHIPSSLTPSIPLILAELYDAIPGSLSGQKQKQTLDLAAGELTSGAKVGVS